MLAKREETSQELTFILMVPITTGKLIYRHKYDIKQNWTFKDAGKGDWWPYTYYTFIEIKS